MSSNGIVLLNLNNRDAADFQRLEVPDSYEKASGALTAGTYVTVYKWLYHGFMLAPSLCDAVDATDHINLVDRTNGGILEVYPDDTISISGGEPPEVRITPLTATENGVYDIPPEYDGFGPVTVDVDQETRTTPLTATENGVYNAVSPIEGFNPVNIAVPIPEQGFVLSGTVDPVASIGTNEQLYVKYHEYSGLDYQYGIVGTFRKVDGAWTDYTAPRLADGMRIWTNSTSGTSASVNFQSGYFDADYNFIPEGDVINVIYNSVTESPRDIDLVSIQYTNGWILRALSRVDYDGTTYESGSTIRGWTFSTSVDFYIKEE